MKKMTTLERSLVEEIRDLRASLDDRDRQLTDRLDELESSVETLIGLLEELQRSSTSPS